MINAFVVRKPQFIGHIMDNMTNLSSDSNHNVTYSLLSFPSSIVLLESLLTSN